MTGADADIVGAGDGLGGGLETGVKVLLPDGVPVVYPQAARVLCRIVVRLAVAERPEEDIGGMKEAAS
jgi:hypothetical protein